MFINTAYPVKTLCGSLDHSESSIGVGVREISVGMGLVHLTLGIKKIKSKFASGESK